MAQPRTAKRPSTSRARPSAPPRRSPPRRARRGRRAVWGALALVVVLSAVILVLALNGSGGGGTSRSANAPAGDVVSEQGIHWHPQLAIYINGEQLTIPANLGIGRQYSTSKWYDPMMEMTDVHTHDSSGTLHWEVMDSMAPVTTEHVRLGVFFEIWGKPFDATQILDYRNGPGGAVTMTVNGKPNTDFDSYLVHDGDRIVIRYE